MRTLTLVPDGQNTSPPVQGPPAAAHHGKKVTLPLTEEVEAGPGPKPEGPLALPQKLQVPLDTPL
jgi:hypothetical protein